MSSTAPGWYPDPYRRHESRYWDGGRWTDHVADGGATAVEPTSWGAPTSPEAAASEVPPEPDPDPDPSTTVAWQPTPPAPPEPAVSWPTPPPVATPPSAWGAPPSNAPPAPPTWGASAAPGGAWSPTAARAPVDTRDRVPAAVALVGAALLLVSAFLPWFDVEVPGTDFSESVTGTDGGDGVLIIVLALVAGTLALLRVLGKGPSQMGIGIVVAGLLATLVGLIDLGDDEPEDAVVAALTDVSPAVGLYLVILGGLVVAVGGALVVVLGRTRRTAP